MLANNLKSLRKQRKLTLDELAEALGTSRQTIHRYENGTITNIPPEKVEKLALVVTLARQNETVQPVVQSWIEMAEKDDFKSMTIDNFEKSYTDSYLKNYRPFYPLIVPFMKPKDKQRFLIQARSCLSHNAADSLLNIKCPVIVIGGAQDKIVGAQASYQISEKIKDSKLIIYQQYGHALYEEAKDFNKKVMEFLIK